MTTYWTKDVQYNAGTLDASGANSIVFAPGRDADVKRIVLVTTVAQTTADAVITVAVRDVDNGNSTTVGTFTLPFTGSATDDVKFVELGKPKTTSTTGVDGSVIYKGHTPGGPVTVSPGQEMALTSNGGGDAGTYQVYFEYEDQGFDAENEDYSELVFTHA